MIRTRFAPSPTGFMHVGSIRTALFAWAIAKQEDGVFILRIEDTDKSREVEGAVAHIIESLAWLGISPDEGPQSGGDHGPYTQSERLDIYQRYAELLIEKGLAYVDPYTAEELAGFREEAKLMKQPFLFRRHRPEKLDVPTDWYGKQALRFKVPDIKPYQWHDEVRGKLSAGEDALDDFILIKADGYPTYNFAHVVDDREMEITHVVRGEEFIPSTPKFLSLIEALGFERPKMVTVPPILNSSGGKKLSKREGAKDVLSYRDAGYLPSAVANFLASLGWNDGSEQEIFSLDEIRQKFQISRIQKSGARFDETKLIWMQWEHAKRLLHESPKQFLDFVDFNTTITDDEYLIEAARLAASKANSIDSFKKQFDIFINPVSLEVSKEWLEEVDSTLTPALAVTYLERAKEALAETNYEVESVETALRSLLNELNAQPRALLNLIRWCVSASKVSPGLFEMISVLSQERVEERLDSAIQQIRDL